MKCISCTAEIPPAWINAIQSNVCPGCGGAIMDEASKELLDELRSAMEKMPNDPEGLAGWLLSNYRLHKIGDAEPTGFHRARPAREDIPDGLKIADNPKSIFLKRAGMARELDRRQQSLADIAQHNNNVGDEAVDGTVSVDMDEIDEYQGLDEYEALALAQQKSGTGLAKNTLQNNSVFIKGDGPPVTSVEAEAIAQALGQSLPSPDHDLPEALQVDRHKRLKAQHDLGSGGKPGAFSRGS